jgi:hypothetical protein
MNPEKIVQGSLVIAEGKLFEKIVLLKQGKLMI